MTSIRKRRSMLDNSANEKEKNGKQAESEIKKHVVKERNYVDSTLQSNIRISNSLCKNIVHRGRFVGLVPKGSESCSSAEKFEFVFYLRQRILEMTLRINVWMVQTVNTTANTVISKTQILSKFKLVTSI